MPEDRYTAGADALISKGLSQNEKSIKSVIRHNVNELVSIYDQYLLLQATQSNLDDFNLALNNIFSTTGTISEQDISTFMKYGLSEATRNSEEELDDKIFLKNIKDKLEEIKTLREKGDAIQANSIVDNLKKQSNADVVQNKSQTLIDSTQKALAKLEPLSKLDSPSDWPQANSLREYESAMKGVDPIVLMRTANQKGLDDALVAQQQSLLQFMSKTEARQELSKPELTLLLRSRGLFSQGVDNVKVRNLVLEYQDKLDEKANLQQTLEQKGTSKEQRSKIKVNLKNTDKNLRNITKDLNKHLKRINAAQELAKVEDVVGKDVIEKRGNSKPSQEKISQLNDLLDNSHQPPCIRPNLENMDLYKLFGIGFTGNVYLKEEVEAAIDKKMSQDSKSESIASNIETSIAAGPIAKSKYTKDYENMIKMLLIPGSTFSIKDDHGVSTIDIKKENGKSLDKYNLTDLLKYTNYEHLEIDKLSEQYVSYEQDKRRKRTVLRGFESQVNDENIKNIKSSYPNLTDAEIHACSVYTTQCYSLINNLQRNGNANSFKKTLKNERKLLRHRDQLTDEKENELLRHSLLSGAFAASAIAKQPKVKYEHAIRSEINLPSHIVESWKQASDNNSSFYSTGFSSASTNRQERYAGLVQINYTNINGRKLDLLSRYEKEQEILISPGEMQVNGYKEEKLPVIFVPTKDIAGALSKNHIIFKDKNNIQVAAHLIDANGNVFYYHQPSGMSAPSEDEEYGDLKFVGSLQSAAGSDAVMNKEFNTRILTDLAINNKQNTLGPELKNRELISDSITQLYEQKHQQEPKRIFFSISPVRNVTSLTMTEMKWKDLKKERRAIEINAWLEANKDKPILEGWNDLSKKQKEKQIKEWLKAEYPTYLDGYQNAKPTLDTSASLNTEEEKSIEPSSNVIIDLKEIHDALTQAKEQELAAEMKPVLSTPTNEDDMQLVNEPEIVQANDDFLIDESIDIYFVPTAYVFRYFEDKAKDNIRDKPAFFVDKNHNIYMFEPGLDGDTPLFKQLRNVDISNLHSEIGADNINRLRAGKEPPFLKITNDTLTRHEIFKTIANEKRAVQDISSDKVFFMPTRNVEQYINSKQEGCASFGLNDEPTFIIDQSANIYLYNANSDSEKLISLGNLSGESNKDILQHELHQGRINNLANAARRPPILALTDIPKTMDKMQGFLKTLQGQNTMSLEYSEQTLDTATFSGTLSSSADVPVRFKNPAFQNLSESILNETLTYRDIDNLISKLKEQDPTVFIEEIDQCNQLLESIKNDQIRPIETKMKAQYVQLELGELQANLRETNTSSKTKSVDDKSIVLQTAQTILGDKKHNQNQKFEDLSKLIELVEWHNSLGENGDNHYKLESHDNQIAFCNILEKAMNNQLINSEQLKSLQDNLSQFKEKNNIKLSKQKETFSLQSRHTQGLLSAFKLSVDAMDAQKSKQKIDSTAELKTEKSKTPKRIGK